MFRRIGLFGKVTALVLLALAVRVGFAWVYVGQHPARALATIPFLFEPGNIAYALATGQGFSSPFRIDTGPTAWMTPVYPMILAGIFRLLGTYTLKAYLAAAGLNILFSALTVVPMVFAGRRIAGERAGLLAASLWAAFPAAVLLPYESLWDASLTVLLLTTTLWATLAVAESARTRDWCLYGLLWGFMLMTNAATASVLPFLLGWAGYRPRARPLPAAIVILLCCMPWTIRNYRVFHALVPLRSVGGLALWIGTRADFEHPISNQAERDRYVELGEIAYMSEKRSEAMSFMLSHPGQEARLAGPRFLAFWTGVNTFPGHSPRYWWVLGFNTLAALGALAGGILLWRQKSPFALPLTVTPIVFPLVYYLALAPPRYKHPIDPSLLLLTGLLNWQSSLRPFRHARETHLRR